MQAFTFTPQGIIEGVPVVDINGPVIFLGQVQDVSGQWFLATLPLNADLFPADIIDQQLKDFSFDHDVEGNRFTVVPDMRNDQCTFVCVIGFGAAKVQVEDEKLVNAIHLTHGLSFLPVKGYDAGIPPATAVIMGSAGRVWVKSAQPPEQLWYLSVTERGLTAEVADHVVKWQVVFNP